ncbi:hypothetical protein Leryth_007064 [Lithospermum erythrorhizon]|nr:hypothetical protein Leryth_007064 [Lithospermum erythrorhizon]
MNIAQSSWLLSVQILLLFSTIKNTVVVSGQCLNDQHHHLLQLKNSLTFDLELSTRLVQWNTEEDCCSWKGVGCDPSGRVITLELDQESISGGEDNLTSLFRLQYLEKLDLSLNSFIFPIPKAIANLTNLMYLNLSFSGFSGQIPVELSSLRKLVSLDLSTWIYGMSFMKLENPSMKMLLQNLSNIEEIYLDHVDLSAQRSEWSQAIATSLPKLRVMSLRYCHISGPIHMSLSSLHNLSVIRLDSNNISAEVPEYFANMPNLITLSLQLCNLVVQFPVKIFQVRTLERLVISYNYLLQGSLPPFPKNSSLRIIDLASCNFSGTIPGLQNLLQLSSIDLSNNNFSGPVPKFQACKNLVYVDLSHNSLTRTLSSDHFKGLHSLEILRLTNNSLSGSLPSSIFNLPALAELRLPNNQFSGQIDEIPGGLSIPQPRLVSLDMSYNQFNGSVPKYFFEFKELVTLLLLSNSFTDTIQLETFKNQPGLESLELSYNNLTVEPQGYNSSLANLTSLKLASCKLKSFPEMNGQLGLSQLDLSDNEITGEIPNWIWNLSLAYVNLSMNFFVGLQKPYVFSPTLYVIDLHSNQLQGEIPIHTGYPVYIDYSRNKFSGPIPSFMEIGPDIICNTNSLQVLDLSYNSLNGTIPPCLVTSGDLGVLNLSGNNLSGSIPDKFPTNCNMQTVDIGMNLLEGKLPRSLSNCALLEVLNVGYNKIEDSFPCMFENSLSLHVLALRSNKFYGELKCFGHNYSWPQLQILDIASNNFSGVLSPEFFPSLKNMLSLSSTNESVRGDHLRFEFVIDQYYEIKVRVTMKGTQLELEKIWTIFTSVDFSNNKFSGKIPESIGDLKELYILDLSNNDMTGEIPSSIGKLKNLGSLDLSTNELTGQIPTTLAELKFLSFLDLSFNTLTGEIPTGTQLQTFSNDSYMGNPGLCGFPLDVSCGINGPSSMPSLNNKKEINWLYISASLGYTVGLGMFFMLLLLCGRWRNMFFHHVDQLLLKVFNNKTDMRIAPRWMEQFRRL